MNVETQVERLQSLLERIQQNAAELSQQRGTASLEVGPSSASPAAVSTSTSGPGDNLAWDEPATQLPPVQPKPSPVELPGDEPALEIEVAEDLSDELGEEDLLTIPPSQPPPDAGETLQGMPPAPALPRDASSLPPAQRDSLIPAHSGPVFAAERKLTATDEARGGLDPDTELRTPPPESGPQVTSSTLLDEPSPAAPAASRPASEQIGASVGFDAAASSTDAVSAELELAGDALPPSAETDEDEASLPRRSFPGQYDASLAPPPNAQADLAARDLQHRPRQDTQQDDGLLAPAPSAAPLATQRAADATHTRSAVRADQPVATYEAPRTTSTEASFLQRLERTLALGR